MIIDTWTVRPVDLQLGYWEVGARRTDDETFMVYTATYSESEAREESIAFAERMERDWKVAWDPFVRWRKGK